MKPESITLISFGHYGKDFLGEIVHHVEREFLLPVETKDGFS